MEGNNASPSEESSRKSGSGSVPVPESKITRKQQRLAQSSRKSRRKLARAAALAAEEAAISLEEQRESLRTASDVIKRVKWDTALDRDEFAVGYMDRFKGLVEERFDTFNWDDDLVDVDDEEELAIPRHRIVYFKWRDVVVWDKRVRLDNVFGSCGGKRIEELVEPAPEPEIGIDQR